MNSTLLSFETPSVMRRLMNFDGRVGEPGVPLGVNTALMLQLCLLLHVPLSPLAAHVFDGLPLGAVGTNRPYLLLRLKLVPA